MGGFLADVHRDHGVDVRLGIGVDGLAGGESAVTGVRLSDGTAVAADVVVVGIGVRPATDWLEGSGLTLDDGVVCDATCLAAPGVVAAGDLARTPLDGPDAPPVRIEHWDNAIEQGAHAARTLLADLAGGRGETFAPVPWFWSDQYDRKLQLAGRAAPDCDVEVVAGSLDDRRFTALYGKDGRLVAALGVNMPAQVMRWRARLGQGVTPWEQAVAEARG
jgi:NADPH-dependent 2,4-dienoyl-CoA reductase/sulfur reductase-like enzyme